MKIILLLSQKLHHYYEVIRPMIDEMIDCCGNYIFGEPMSFETDHDLDSSPINLCDGTKKAFPLLIPQLELLNESYRLNQNIEANEDQTLIE